MAFVGMKRTQPNTHAQHKISFCLHFLNFGFFILFLSSFYSAFFYTDFDGRKALAAFDNTKADDPVYLDDFVEAWCPQVLEGIEQLCDYLSKP